MERAIQENCRRVEIFDKKVGGGRERGDKDLIKDNDDYII